MKCGWYELSFEIKENLGLWELHEDHGIWLYKYHHKIPNITM